MTVIEYQRRIRNLSQAKLAEVLGVSKMTVCLWENEKSVPTPENLFKLGRFFKLPVESLLGKMS